MKISRVALFMIVQIIYLVGCTTTQTQKLVVSEPMSEDLEARVLRETGISGATIGALGGGLAGFGAGFLAATIAGADPTTAVLTGAGTGAVGAIGGGVYGYHEGKKQGQKIVASAMRRDQLEKLLVGAKAYNTRLGKVNAQLQKELTSLRSQSPSPQRARDSKQISQIASREIREATKRIAQRQKALDNPQWVYSQKARYQQEQNKLKTETNQLKEIMEAATLLSK